MTSYRYADRDLLVEPGFYMYTPFEGPGFLRAYLAQRAAAVALLRERAPRPLADELSGRVPQVLPARPGVADVETREVLLDLAGGDGGEEWLAFLVSRFEVTKRLYERYTAELQPAEDRHELLDNYVLLAAVAADRYRRGGNLKHLNVALKLGDLLSASDLAEASSLALSAAREALEAELAAVRSLLDEHGIDL